MSRPLSILTLAASLALVGGCGVHQTQASTPTAVETESATAMTRQGGSQDVDLVVGSAVSTPHGPTTASTITLALTFANLGDDFTPYGYDHGTLGYTPIHFSVTRDGALVAAGVVHGLTGRDQAAQVVELRDQAPGDKTYVITIDNGDEISERDESNNTATVTVVYGGSG